MKTKKYKNYVFEFSKPSIGFFSSGRGGKVIKKIWVTDELGIFGRWFDSETQAKKYVDALNK